jgi:hypothetical protein
MPGILLRVSKRSQFLAEGFLVGVACALSLWLTPVHGQDDSAVPPAPDSVPPASDSAAPAPDGVDAAPDDSASFQTFYDSLGSQGTWIQSSDYGYVWQPQVDDPDWAPYTAGHWAYTDDGWTWVSDESWGWATYHYGRWVNIDGTGWCWVPGYTWAPAWVSWRYGDGYCGWAPLPPDSFIGIDYSDDGFALGIGFHIGGDCDGFYGIGAGWYTFLPVNCLGYRHYRGYYCHRANNFAIINRTTNVTNINVARSTANVGGGRRFGRVTAGGPALAQVNAVSTTPIPKVNLVRANQVGGGGTLTSSSLTLYAPHVNPGATAQPGRVTGSIGQARVNRGTDITRPPAVNSMLAPSPATEPQVQQARLAQSQAPAGAKVVTDSAQVKPLLQVPLTSMKPMARQVNPAPTFDTTPATVFPAQRAPTTSGINPAGRTYPQVGNVPSHVYYPETVSPSPVINQPHAPAATASGGSGTHTYVRPSVPTYSPSPASGTRPAPSSGGGYSNGGGSHTPSGGGGTGFHSSGSSQSH